MNAGPYTKEERYVSPYHGPNHSDEAKYTFTTLKKWWGINLENADDEDISTCAKILAKARIDDANAKHSKH